MASSYKSCGHSRALGICAVVYSAAGVLPGQADADFNRKYCDLIKGDASRLAGVVIDLLQSYVVDGSHDALMKVALDDEAPEGVRRRALMALVFQDKGGDAAGDAIARLVDEQVPGAALWRDAVLSLGRIETPPAATVGKTAAFLANKNNPWDQRTVAALGLEGVNSPRVTPGAAEFVKEALESSRAAAESWMRSRRMRDGVLAMGLLREGESDAVAGYLGVADKSVRCNAAAHFVRVGGDRKLVASDDAQDVDVLLQEIRSRRLLDNHNRTLAASGWTVSSMHYLQSQVTKSKIVLFGEAHFRGDHPLRKKQIGAPKQAVAALGLAFRDSRPMS